MLDLAMAGSINYTFIIPHKNIPHLLVRCLAAIPRRPDVQIIIVDDASDPSVVDFAHFPGLDDPQVEVVFAKKGRGAGYARNVGLERAVGKWIVFADADDYYLDNLPAMMDRYVDSDADMVIFKEISCSVEGERLPDHPLQGLLFGRYFTHNDLNALKYHYYVPHGRFIRREAIGGLRFQEVAYSNDVLFFLRFQTGDIQICVVDEAIYAYVRRPNSLLQTQHWKNPYTRCHVAMDTLLYFKSKGDPNAWRYGMPMIPIHWWRRVRELNKWAALRLIPRIYRVTGYNLFPGFVRSLWASRHAKRRQHGNPAAPAGNPLQSGGISGESNSLSW